MSICLHYYVWVNIYMIGTFILTEYSIRQNLQFFCNSVEKGDQCHEKRQKLYLENCFVGILSFQ